MIALPDAGNCTIIASFVWKRHRNVTEGRTYGQRDGQTESLWLLQRSALRAMRTRCKNHGFAYACLFLLPIGRHDKRPTIIAAFRNICIPFVIC